MATRKRNSKRAEPKPQTSVAAAQAAANRRRLARLDERDRKLDEAKRKESGQKKNPLAGTRLEPRTGAPMANSGRGVDQDKVAERDGRAGESSKGKPAVGLSEAANKIAGLGLGVMKQRQDERRALADTSLYGAAPKDRAKALGAQMEAADKARRGQLSKQGSAVYWGPKIANAKIRRSGPERFGDGDSDLEEVGPVGDDIRSKEELLSWLTDETVFNQIKKRMNDAGLAVESYDDVAKLWKSVVDQAAATYSTTGKKVTPFAIVALRAKNMGADGKPASRTTTSTSIEEMDPAQARLMIEKSATDLLGRAPRPDELEDFIAKAQTIARQNPNVTKTTTEFGFDGEATGQSSVSSGGADVVSAKAQVAAQDAAMQDEEYGAFQAAGTYLPWLTDALASPI